MDGHEPQYNYSNSKGQWSQITINKYNNKKIWKIFAKYLQSTIKQNTIKGDMPVYLSCTSEINVKKEVLASIYINIDKKHIDSFNYLSTPAPFQISKLI